MDLKNLDKSGWKKYRFEQIASNISERVEPGETDLEIYVGLEHLDSNSIHIKRWGKPSDVEGTKLKVYPGDLIFGKRRAYQRKAAIATFEGICSAHAMVLRANPAVIDPQLFPFFIHSDAFMHRAVDISVGSLSPTINWSTLRVQEFLLPPKDQQARLAELLWAGDAVVEGYDRMWNVLKSVKSAYFDRVYWDTEVKRMSLGDCLEYSQYGISESLSETGEIPVLRMNNIVEGKVTFDDLKYVDSKSIPKLETLMLKKGDILFNRTNSFDLVGKVGIVDSDMQATFASYLIRLKANDNIVSPKYLNLYLNSVIGQRLIKIHRTPGVSQSNINPENLKKIDVPILPISKQRMFLEKVDALEKSEIGYLTLQKRAKAALNLLLNQIFTP